MRRRSAEPARPKPAIISAQAAGSGTAADGRSPKVAPDAAVRKTPSGRSKLIRAVWLASTEPLANSVDSS